MIEALEILGWIAVGALVTWAGLLHWHGTVSAELDLRARDLDRRQQLITEYEDGLARRQIGAHFRKAGER